MPCQLFDKKYGTLGQCYLEGFSSNLKANIKS